MLDDDGEDEKPRAKTKRRDDDQDRPRRKKKSRDDEDDEDDDENDEETRIPGIVRAAGIIWIVYGAFGLLNGMINLILVLGERGANAGGAGAGGGANNPAAPFCGIAVAFAYCGFQTLKGQAKDTIGNAIGSLALGALMLLIGIVLIAVGGGKLPIDPGVVMITAAIVLVFALMLLIAGVLALMGRGAYLEWRETAHPTKRLRRRPRRREADEEN